MVAKRAEALRRRCIREGGQLPTHWTAEWQETLQSPRAVSGFLDVSRRTGFADWRLLRISATFLAGEPRPAPLSALFLPGRQQQLRPLLEQKLADLARQTETPFYRCPAQGLPAALRSGGEQGLLHDYSLRYLRTTWRGNEYIIFADVSSANATMQNLWRSCILIGLCAAAVFLAVSFLLARWAVKPV